MIGLEKLYSGKAYSLRALTVSDKCLVKDFIEKLNKTPVNQIEKAKKLLKEYQHWRERR